MNHRTAFPKVYMILLHRQTKSLSCYDFLFCWNLWTATSTQAFLQSGRKSCKSLRWLRTWHCAKGYKLRLLFKDNAA